MDLLHLLYNSKYISVIGYINVQIIGIGTKKNQYRSITTYELMFSALTLRQTGASRSKWSRKHPSDDFLPVACRKRKQNCVSPRQPVRRGTNSRLSVSLFFLFHFSQANKVRSAPRCKNMKMFQWGKSLKTIQINFKVQKKPWFGDYNDSIRILLYSNCTPANDLHTASLRDNLYSWVQPFLRSCNIT